MSSEESTGFIEGGERIFLKELAEEEQKALAPLREKRKETSDAAIKKILQEQIKVVERRFKERRKAAEASLF